MPRYTVTAQIEGFLGQDYGSMPMNAMPGPAIHQPSDQGSAPMPTGAGGSLDNRPILKLVLTSLLAGLAALLQQNTTR